MKKLEIYIKSYRTKPQHSFKMKNLKEFLFHYLRNNSIIYKRGFEEMNNKIKVVAEKS